MNQLRKCFGYCLASLFVVGCLVPARPSAANAELSMEILAVSSFESGKMLATAELEFDRDISIESMRFEDSEGEDEPFYFVPAPGASYRGRLFWMWREMPFFHEMNYVLRMSEGEWKGEPFGDAEIGKKVGSEKYLLPNHAFEELDEDGAPVGWTLDGTAEISEEEALAGSRSVRIEVTEEKSGRFETIELVPLEPGKRYRISCRIKIVERVDSGNTRWQLVEIDLRPLDENRRRLGRTMGRLNTSNMEEEEYLGKWVRLTGTVTTPEDTRYGEVAIYTRGLHGKFYVDEIILDEDPPGQPVRLEFGEIE